jgi:hypothetical protein
VDFSNILTISFFGHRQVEDSLYLEEQVYTMVCDLIYTHEYVNFLAGQEGEFDQIVSSSIKKAKRQARNDNSALTLILPYEKSEYEKNREYFEAYYDEIEICSEAAACFCKTAYSVRNRVMIDRSDLVIFYVDHCAGGAYCALLYARQKGKAFTNLAKK